MNKNPTPKQYLTAAGLVFLGAVFVSSKAILVKLAYQYEIDSASLLTLRLLFSFPIFAGILIWHTSKKSTDLPKLKTKDWVRIALLGMSGYYGASLCDFIGLEYITASFERIILYLYPTIVLILSAVFLKQKITKIHIIALALTYVGVGLAFWENLQLNLGDNVILGTFFVFMSAFFYAFYLLGGGVILPKVGTIRFNSIAMMAAGLGMFTHHLLFVQTNVFSFPIPVYWLVLIMAIFATIIPTFLIVEGVRVIGSNNAAIITSIGPISTIVLAYIFLDERLGWIQWTGTLFVIAGVLLITLKKKL